LTIRQGTERKEMSSVKEKVKEIEYAQLWIYKTEDRLIQLGLKRRDEYIWMGTIYWFLVLEPEDLFPSILINPSIKLSRLKIFNGNYRARARTVIYNRFASVSAWRTGVDGFRLYVLSPCPIQTSDHIQI
jgi:hypothetical protein